MFRIKRNASLSLICVPSVLLLLCGGCGSSSGSNNSMNNSLSPAQAQAVTDQVGQALTQALTVTFSADTLVERNAHPSLSRVVSDIQSDASSGCTATATGQTCNWPISLPAYPCVSAGGADEGSVSVTGDIDGSLSTAGDGSVSTQITITPSNCAVSNLVIDGDPSISVAGQINFTNTAPTFPIIFTETGGISYGPNPSGSCQLNATYTINSLTSCTVSGTVCGQPVSGSC
jgi:hypothetical protein